ncbi:MAG: cytidylyltransferase domain-containing protein [Clostridium sp.]|uniref:acylneuraminate cytidylyltransferase family protein n=1 Tax=Clostridium TaxID=1485 RepID=UPI0021533E27|nr:acylneuraminate cytidylyltransferase family protein [Clostridium sp. LY3-2]MCR6513568.1 acylneuraminate cytidylyltransferase family protein [Clostridium sp. LY3-2]
MYKDKKILGIIPARSGSKGIKDKNIKPLLGEPLIKYTIDAALNSNMIDDLIVSTDSKTYANISKELGAKVPFLREDYLASDEAKTSDVIIDILEKINEDYDYFILLQPTSPLRNENHIKEAIKLGVDSECDSVVSVCEVDHSPMIMNTLDEDLGLFNFIKSSNRRQDNEKFYRINGAIYISKVNHYKKTKDFYLENSKAYIMDRRDSIDIDDILDFQIAEAIMKRK